jgi:hypothetical protein
MLLHSLLAIAREGTAHASVREHRVLHLLISLHTGKGTASAEHMSLQSVDLSVMGWKQLC